MSTAVAPDAWDSGEAYERYVGRWSRRVAKRFLAWVRPPPRAAWADVGCGTGALASTILRECDPVAISGIDASPQFVQQAQRRIDDRRVRLDVGDATALPWPGDSFDYAVSGLVLNFVKDHAAMVREMARVTRPGGTVALYVWDYADGMQMMRAFWDAAAEVDPDGVVYDESTRFPICHPDALHALLDGIGLTRVQTMPIEIATVFADFDDYWMPFLGKTGAAPAYLATLAAPRQNQIRDHLRARLQTGAHGEITMQARAWAVRGAVV